MLRTGERDRDRTLERDRGFAGEGDLERDRRRLIGDRDLDRRRLIGDRDLDRRRLIGDRDLVRRRVTGDRDLVRRRLIGERDLVRIRLTGERDLERARPTGERDLDRGRKTGDRDLFLLHVQTFPIQSVGRKRRGIVREPACHTMAWVHTICLLLESRKISSMIYDILVSGESRVMSTPLSGINTSLGQHG